MAQSKSTNTGLFSNRKTYTLGTPPSQAAPQDPTQKTIQRKLGSLGHRKQGLQGTVPGNTLVTVPR